MRIKEIYLLILGFIIFVFSFFAKEFTVEESFIIAFQIYLVLRFINNIGYTVCFFDFLCFYSVMDTLLMPMIGYKIFNINNELIRLWGWYMRVPEDVYYEFLIPANVALFVGVNLLIYKYKPVHFKKISERLALDAKSKGKVGIVLTIIGFVSTLLNGFESSLSFVFYLCSMLKYVGPFYIYFSDLPFRKKAFFLSLLMFLIQSIVQGLFGEFFMYLILALIILALRYNLGFFKKLTVFVTGIVIIMVLQSVKGAYRHITWGGGTVKGLSSQNSSKLSVFSSLFVERLSNPEQLLDEKTLFLIYTRMNQGYLISRAMNYVPRVEPYANGETIIRSVQAIIVPRILWPDKPEAGGRENLSRFLGIKKKLNYSMNIGPYGEAYGNFGPFYGVVFIFFYALSLSLLFRLLIAKSENRATLLLWAPLLFFSTLTVETDILSTLNAFVKGALFVWFFFWAAKRFLKIEL